MKWMPVETVLLWSGVWEGVWDRWSSLKHSYHLPAQAPFSVRVSISGEQSECLRTNGCAKTDTLFSVMGATQAPMGIWRALCQPPGFDLENLSTVTLRTLSSILRSPGVGQCPTTGWVGWSQPLPPAQGRFSPVWFLGLKS